MERVFADGKTFVDRVSKHDAAAIMTAYAAEKIRQRWMANNERAYANVFKMVKKYNVEDITLEAGGGEYPVQDEFG